MKRNFGKFNAVGCAILLRMNFRLRAFVFLFSAFVFGTVVQAVEVAPVTSKLCDLQDARINESSGLAASRKYARQGLLWTHNDSQGPPRIYLFNAEGETIAQVEILGAINTDWEDIAITNDFIYIGDIGDNLRRRESVTIYRLREPQLDFTRKNQEIEVSCEKMVLNYPDAACDAETLMATAGGELFLVSKNGGASRFYKTPRPFEKNGTQTLELIGEYSFTGATARSYLTTGGEISPDETRFIVRTYTHAYEWSLPLNRDWKSALGSTPRLWELPVSKQGEAICYSADGQEYFVSEEGVRAPIWRIEFSPIY